MTADDKAYKKSVRNMVLVLVAIVVTAFAGVLIPPYLSSPPNTFKTAVEADSPVGFAMHLTLNSTSLSQNATVLVTGWVNSTSSSLENITAMNSWVAPMNRLWTRICTNGFPIGIGVMKGHYTGDNYSIGTLLQIPRPEVLCPIPASSPQYFILEAHSSKALVSIGGSPAIWLIQTSFAFRGYSTGGVLPRGTYTAIMTDEWGDVLTTNFRVS